MTESKLLSTLGLCARARKIVVGTDMVCESVREQGKNRTLIVIVSKDSSSGTNKKITDKCRYYKVPKYTIGADSAELGHAVGKSSAVAVVGVKDLSLSLAVKKALENESYAPDRETVPDHDQAE